VTSFRSPQPIAAEHDVASFDCGEPSLNEWMSQRALKNERGRASRTFVSIEMNSNLVAGYYCLSSSSLGIESAPGRLRRNMPDPIPVILLGRLAVDKRFASQGLGASLLQHALLKAVEASRIIGARALLVHALSDSARDFYARFGFTLMPDSERTMYLLLDDAELTITQL